MLSLSLMCPCPAGVISALESQFGTLLRKKDPTGATLEPRLRTCRCACGDTLLIVRVLGTLGSEFVVHALRVLVNVHVMGADMPHIRATEAR